MKKLTNGFIIVILLSLSITANAADTKVKGRLYANWNLDVTDGAESANSFNVKRAYMTVKSKLSDYTSARITTDIRSLDSYEGYSIILKYGYIDWKPSFSKSLKMRVGLQPTMYIDNMNKLWGRRYLEKTVGDKNKVLTTSDLGVSTFINLGEKGKAGYLALQILNGTKYSNVEELNKNKDIGLFALLKPFFKNDDLKRSRILAQAYSGTQNKSLVASADTTITGIDTTVISFANEASQFSNKIISFGGILGYRKTFDLGVDLNFQTKGKGYDSDTGAELDDVKSSNISVFGTLYFEDLSESFGKTLNIYGRFDKVDPNSDKENDGKSLLIVGLECSPTKGVKSSINIRTTSYEDSRDSESHLFFNTLFKF